MRQAQWAAGNWCRQSPPAVQTFFVKNHRNAEPTVLDKKLLDGVSEFRLAARVLALARIAGATDLPETMTFFESGFGFPQIEVAVGIYERFSFLLPDAHHLRGFFFQRHPRQKVFDSFSPQATQPSCKSASWLFYYDSDRQQMAFSCVSFFSR